MPIPGFSSRELGSIAPNWLQSRIIDPKLMLPGGVYLDLASFSVPPFTTTTPGKVTVPSGTPIARTLADRAANKGYQPLTDALATAIAAAPSTYEVSILYGDLTDLAANWHGEGIQPNAGNLILENFLPNFQTMTTGQLAILRSNFVLILGRP